ncbi:unnamed protein product [Ascophyllum nodosum]
MAPKEPQESKSDVESHARPVKDRTVFPPILPADFAYWKLTPPAVGLVGLGVYLGFRKQIKTDAIGAQVLASHAKAPLPFDPYRHATRALMYGTALCLGCASLGVVAVGYWMRVRNLREFSDKMKVWAPEQMHRLGFRHRPEFIRDREAMRGLTYDQEWEYTMRLIQEDEPELETDNPSEGRDVSSASRSEDT